MKSTLRKLVVVATYNEMENLPRLVEGILRAVPDTDLLVVDDNSPDGTGTWCDQFAQTEPRLQCLHRSAKLGLGSATIGALQWAISQGYSYVATMDADFSHAPEYLPELFAGVDLEHGSADVIIGSRYVEGGGIIGWPAYRWWMSRAINTYARGMLGLRVRDCSGGFRCYRVEILKRLELHSVRSTGYAYLEELLWLLTRAGATLTETPITFVDRQRGQTKINVREILRALWVVTQLGMREWFGPKPAVPTPKRHGARPQHLSTQKLNSSCYSTTDSDRE